MRAVHDDAQAVHFLNEFPAEGRKSAPGLFGIARGVAHVVVVVVAERDDARTQFVEHPDPAQVLADGIAVLDAQHQAQPAVFLVLDNVVGRQGNGRLPRPGLDVGGDVHHLADRFGIGLRLRLLVERAIAHEYGIEAAVHPSFAQLRKVRLHLRQVYVVPDEFQRRIRVRVDRNDAVVQGLRPLAQRLFLGGRLLPPRPHRHK